MTTESPHHRGSQVWSISGTPKPFPQTGEMATNSSCETPCIDSKSARNVIDMEKFSVQNLLLLDGGEMKRGCEVVHPHLNPLPSRERR
jgi:hypothetical protein